MSLQQLPNGKWRAQVYDSGRNVSVGKILGGSSVFPSKREAKMARERARERLGTAPKRGITVRAFSERWLTDPLFATPKESTAHKRASIIRPFIDAYGDHELAQISDDVVSEYLAGGKKNYTAVALRAMWTAAASKKAGRLIRDNPWAGLGLSQGTGNRHRQPPTIAEFESLQEKARALTPPSFAAWLKFACLTGCRPGEVDALSWDAVDFEAGKIGISEQYSDEVRRFTEPKEGPYECALVAPARELLLSIPRESRFVFVPLVAEHYTRDSRRSPWDRTRAAAGVKMTLYMCTRHYFGWYAINVLKLEPWKVAAQLGHRDGGKLVIQLYGHPDRDVAFGDIRDAFEQDAKVVPLRVVGS